ncbi:MAG: response regulator [Deltaproteobacteria bacterium]|nr:response regulator [Deltaproteobacteria bacterium]
MAAHDASVLVVDDEIFFREAIRDALSLDGLTLVFAENGEEALDLAADTQVGVVVLDIRLPDVDGIQVLERLRELRPGLRVIILSASTDQDLVLDALRLGASDYLAKPIHDEELRLAVRRALESYSVATDWTRLRGRLDRLVVRMEELAARACTVPAEERLALIQEGVTTAASEVLEAERTSLLMIEPDGERMRVVASVGHEMKPDEMVAVSLHEGIAGLALQRGEPLVVDDVSRDADAATTDTVPDTVADTVNYADFIRPDRYRSPFFVVAPLRRGSSLFGVLCATDRADGGRFGRDDLALLRLLAMQIAELVAPPASADLDISLDAMRTQEFQPMSAPVTASQPKPDDEEVDRDADLAREICLAIVDEVEPERVILAALKPVCSMLPAAPVSLYLLDARSGELRREGECDGGVNSDREALVRDLGLTGTVLQTGCVIATDDPEADPRFDPLVDTPQSGQARAFLCAPIRLRGKVVGLFRAFLDERTAASARTAEVLSAALSAAVRNALLYRSLLESIEEVAEARRAARQ